MKTWLTPSPTGFSSVVGVLTLHGPSIRTKHPGLDDPTANPDSTDSASVSGRENVRNPAANFRDPHKRQYVPQVGASLFGLGWSPRRLPDPYA